MKTVNEQEVTLVALTEELRAEFLTMAEEYLAAGEDRYKAASEDFSAYLRRLSDALRGINLPPGTVPYSAFWLVAGRRLLGRSTVRHHLTSALECEGGHVGYDIRPSQRGKGYGTLLLKLTLGEARRLGLRRVYLTCDTDNLGSAKVIEENGGVLRDTAISQMSGKQISRYWIELWCRATHNNGMHPTAGTLALM
jgi:predicted acetyltransferase